MIPFMLNEVHTYKETCYKKKEKELKDSIL